MNEKIKSKILLFILFILLGGAIFLLAGSLPELRLKPGEPLNLLDWILAQLASVDFARLPENSIEPGGSGIWDHLSDAMRGSILVVFWVSLVFSIIYAFISPEFRRELVRMFMLVLTMLVLLPYIARRMTEQFDALESEGAPIEYPDGETFFPQPPPFVDNPPDWMLVLVKGLLLLLIFAGIYFLWRYFRPRSDARAVVARHIRQALSDMDSGLEFGDVVIACYTRMCRELQKNRQVQRQEYMTPREFEAHLAGAGISSVHIQQLTELFEGVRYGNKPTNPAKENQARQNLQAILQAYGE